MLPAVSSTGSHLRLLLDHLGLTPGDRMLPGASLKHSEAQIGPWNGPAQPRSSLWWLSVKLTSVAGSMRLTHPWVPTTDTALGGGMAMLVYINNGGGGEEGVRATERESATY